MTAGEQKESPRNVVHLTVLTSPRSAYRNTATAKVVAHLLAAVRMDKRLSIAEIDFETVAEGGSLSGLVLNLSAHSAVCLLDENSPETRLLDIRLRDGHRNGGTLQEVACRRTYLFGVCAVLGHPASIGLEVLYWVSRQSPPRSLGGWWGRGNAKSVKTTVRALLAGCYLPLDSFFAYLAEGHDSDDYHLLGPLDLCTGVPSQVEALTDLFVYAGRYTWRTFRNLGRRQTEIQWNVGVASVSDKLPSISSSAQWATPRDNGSYADPFLIVQGDERYVFFEEFDFRDKKGFISVTAFSSDGQLEMSTRRLALKTSAHLSFPFVFEFNDEVFMLPEQANTRQLVMYRAVDFPTGWVEAGVLLHDVEAADPVLFEHEGVWHLFFSDARGGNHDNNLQMYVANSPQGPFVRHPCSPLRLSLDGSRMAGPILREGRRLFRLGQNCSHAYGGGVVLFEIQELSRESYREIRVREAGPLLDGRFDRAYHTYSRVGDIVVFDGARLVTTHSWRDRLLKRGRLPLLDTGEDPTR